MDRICSALLEKINALTGVGRYVIISDDEFFECFPEGAKPDGGELKRALRALIADGYIDLKYSSGNMFCVAPVKKFEPENVAEKELPEPKRDNSKSFPFSVFLAALTGSMAGSLIVSLLFAFV